MSSRAEFRFFDTLRVRWAEVDLQKIVFNGHYLMYLDTAVAGYWRALALPYHEAMEQLAGDLYVRKATLEYHASARYDDRLDVGMRCQRIGNSSILVVAGVFHGDRLLVSGELVYVFADPATQTSRPVPAALRETLLAFEAGEAMASLTQEPFWPAGQARQALDALQERRAPPGLSCRLRNRLGQEVGTASLTDVEDGSAAGTRAMRVQEFQVHPGVRGSGLGRRLVQAAAQAARERGAAELLLCAPQAQLGFLQRVGFAVRSQGQEDGGAAWVEAARAV